MSDDYRCGCGAFLTETPGPSGHMDDFNYACRNPRHKRTGETTVEELDALGGDRG